MSTMTRFEVSFDIDVANCTRPRDWMRDAISEGLDYHESVVDWEDEEIGVYENLTCFKVSFAINIDKELTATIDSWIPDVINLGLYDGEVTYNWQFDEVASVNS